ncbi:hypothetical protein Tco_1118388 [Tanacetum coccineum]
MLNRAYVYKLWLIENKPVRSMDPSRFDPSSKFELSQINKFSKHKVYSIQKILSVVSVKVERLHGYGHLDEIVKSPSIKRRVEDLQLGVESYQKKLNITEPRKTFLGIEFKELYTPLYKPPGVIYEDLNKQKRVMRADELYKFSDGTLKTSDTKVFTMKMEIFLEPTQQKLCVGSYNGSTSSELEARVCIQGELLDDLENVFRKKCLTTESAVNFLQHELQQASRSIFGRKK